MPGRPAELELVREGNLLEELELHEQQQLELLRELQERQHEVVDSSGDEPARWCQSTAHSNCCAIDHPA